MNVLLVAMYWPPAGGAGVTRPLKYAVHLAELGFDVHVLAPDDPKWLHRDESNAPPHAVTVHRARNLGPPVRFRREALRGVRGFNRVALRAQMALRRVLVPDASVLWTLTAVPAAVRIVRRAGIDVVVTTSPPISVNLVGLAAKGLTGVRWIADLRDSIASHPDRLRHLRGERTLARLVARRADAVTCASKAIAREAASFNPNARVELLENACDFEDFADLPYRPGERFRITHTGSFIGRRDPRPFLEALARASGDVVARFVGDFRASDRAYAERLGLGPRIELIPYQPRARTLALQRDSEALLLLLPEAGEAGRGVLSAKVFEYLAAERPILAVVPPAGEAAELVRETGAGIVVGPEDVDGIAAALAELAARWRAGSLDGTRLPAELRARLSRRERVDRLAALLRSVA